MHEYLLVHFINPIPVGSQVNSLPLHTTLMPWFASDRDPIDILNVVQSRLERQTPLKLLVDQPAMFGRDKNIPVNKIILTRELRQLHLDLLAKLKGLEVKMITPEYIGPGWLPHITQKPGQELAPGQLFKLDSLHVIEAASHKLVAREVIGQLQFAAPKAT